MRPLLVPALLVAGCAHAPPPERACAPQGGYHAAHGYHAVHGHAGSRPDGHESAANQHMHQADFGQLVARFEDPSRAEWQKPDTVIAALGDLKGKTVADLGAGTGYFVFRLLGRAERVIATDIDERFLAYVRGRASTLPPSDRGRIVYRLVGTDRPGLVPEEADLALVVDVYHHIEDRVAWLRALAAGLKPGGEVVIVDFKPGDFPDAPPPNLRVAVATVVNELETAGFEQPTVDETLLPRQFAVRAKVAPGK